MIDLGFVYFCSYTYFTNSYFPTAPNMGTCAGEEFAAVAGVVILSSYLVLFISFYLATYRKPLTKKGRSRATSALVEMKDEKLPTIAETRRRFSGGKKDLMPAGFTTGSKENDSPRVTRSRKA